MLALLTLLQLPLCATIFYVDPAIGNMSNDGSFSAPWRTLQEVFDLNLIQTRSYSPLPYTSASTLVIKNSGSPVRAGDTLMLRNGFHGSIFYRGLYNIDYITIMNQSGHQPTLSDIQFSASAKIILDGLIISPENAPSFFYSRLFYVESHNYHGPSRDVIIRNCRLSGITDQTGWGLTEWNEVGSCIHMDGNVMVIENNQCHNVDHGITMVGDSAEVRNNQVVNFAGDGMRGLGSYLIFENNLVKNCYEVNGNHDDGFQSFTSTDNPFVGNILRGNIIINYDDPSQPFKGSLQGIGCFDGPYVDWVIENNLVVVNHYHGISLYGAENCTIVNNTVVDIDSVNSPNGTWILITDHKNGIPSSNCMIQNNISFGFSYGPETEFRNNLLVGDYTNFVSAPTANFRLSSGSSAIDGGENSGAPTIDLDGNIRPQNGIVDIGAYEYIPLPDCTRDTWVLNQNMNTSNVERVHQWLSSSGPVQVLSGTTHDITIGDFAELNPGFEIMNHVLWDLRIMPCKP